MFGRFIIGGKKAVSIIVTSIDAPIGDTAGGTQRTIIGLGFIGLTASDVLFDATPVSSIIVDSNTTIRVIIPAHAAGPVDISVSGTILTGAFTYWNISVPTTASIGFYGPDYALNGFAGVGQWIHKVGNVPNIGIVDAMVSSSVNESPVVAADGVPTFNRSGAQPYRVLRFGGSGHAYTGLEYFTWVELINSDTANPATVAFIINIDNINSSSSVEYEGNGIAADNNFRGHISLTTSSAPAVLRWYWYENAFRKIEVTLPAATGRVVAILRRSGSPAYWQWSIDGGSTWTATNAGSQTAGITNGSGLIRFGYNDNSPNGAFAGTIKAIIFYKIGFSNTDAANFLAWANAEHP